MTIEEAQAIIKNTNSPYLKRDLKKFIMRQKRKGGHVWEGQENK